jgi:nucleoside-diphosphate-sugar epimerase
MLADFEIAGVDLVVPPAEFPVLFHQMDLGREASCRAMVSLLRETGAMGVVHLAFAGDGSRSTAVSSERDWHTNVAGTARVMEAITEVNRTGGNVTKFVFLSSVAAYGPDLERPATEESRLRAEGLPYAVQKREADEVVQFRASSLGQCTAYILRSHIFGGANVHNFVLDALRGIPGGKRKGAAGAKRVPILLPRGNEYLNKQFQLVHIDDIARVIAYILRMDEGETHDGESGVTVLNVAGRGPAITIAEAVEMAEQTVVQSSEWLCRRKLRSRYKRGISSVPPEALPYISSASLLDTSRLRKFLSSDYEDVIRYTVVDALKDSLRRPDPQESTPQPEDQTVA